MSSLIEGLRPRNGDSFTGSQLITAVENAWAEGDISLAHPPNGLDDQDRAIQDKFAVEIRSKSIAYILKARDKDNKPLKIIIDRKGDVPIPVVESSSSVTITLSWGKVSSLALAAVTANDDKSMNATTELVPITKMTGEQPGTVSLCVQPRRSDVNLSGENVGGMTHVFGVVGASKPSFLHTRDSCSLHTALGFGVINPDESTILPIIIGIRTPTPVHEAVPAA